MLFSLINYFSIASMVYLIVLIGTALLSVLTAKSMGLKKKWSKFTALVPSLHFVAVVYISVSFLIAYSSTSSGVRTLLSLALLLMVVLISAGLIFFLVNKKVKDYFS